MKSAYGNQFELSNSSINNQTSSFVISDGFVQGTKSQSTFEVINHLEWLIKSTSTSTSTFVWYYTNVAITSIRQGSSNPTCGLVALSMAMNILDNEPEKNEVLNLLSSAVKLNYTKKGEMFSVFKMKKLAEKFTKTEVDVTPFNQQRIIEKLNQGFPILIPYDSDRDGSPCCKNGHSAHWAVLTGFAIGDSKIPTETNKLHSIDSSVKKTDSSFHEMIQNYFAHDGSPYDHTSIWVFAKQGKSSRLALWNMNDLEASNANLVERNPLKDWNQFHCPFDLKETLCGYVVELR